MREAFSSLAPPLSTAYVAICIHSYMVASYIIEMILNI